MISWTFTALEVGKYVGVAESLFSPSSTSGVKPQLAISSRLSVKVGVDVIVKTGDSVLWTNISDVMRAIGDGVD